MLQIDTWHPPVASQPLSSSARACRPTIPPRAAHPDPRDAYCSRNPPPLPCDAPSLAARAAAPPSASHRLPTPARRYSRCHRGSRETRPLLPIPHPCPARPPSLSSGKRATRSRLLANRRPAPVRAPRTRESVPAASSRRSRRDVRSVGASAFSCSTLSSKISQSSRQSSCRRRCET